MNEEKNKPEEELTAGNLPAGRQDMHSDSYPKTGEPASKQAPNPQPQTSETMEVHAHTHTPRKKWTHYFWEFLMLFLAVFCGFLAEYYLEHRIEKERGIQYVYSFYKDLKTDTATISIHINIDDEKINRLDKLGECYQAVSKNNRETECLFDLIKSTAYNNPFKFTDRTLQQLANAGGFRLMAKADADSIAGYRSALNGFGDFQATAYQEVQENIRNTFNMLVNFTANAQMFKPHGGRVVAIFNNSEITEPVLFSNDKTLMNRYFNELQLYYRVTYNHKNSLLQLKEKQISLLEYFKNKYHLE